MHRSMALVQGCHGSENTSSYVDVLTCPFSSEPGILQSGAYVLTINYKKHLFWSLFHGLLPTWLWLPCPHQAYSGGLLI